MRILVLSTWFPYPTDQGSKIRAYHLIRGLAQRNELAMVSFEDKPVQPAWIEHMRQFCSRIEVVPQKPFTYTSAGTIRGWLSVKPSAVVAGYSHQMADCVQQVANEWKPDMVLAITFVTVPYALQLKGLPKMLDVDNLLAYMLYEEYQATQHPLKRARRYLAYWKMFQYEQQMFRKFDLCLIVSDRDNRRVQENFRSVKSLVGIVPNGVDLEYYQPGISTVLENQLIFNGALTYSPNYNAMRFFLGEIFPKIRAKVPGAHLYITGSTQGVDIDSLPNRQNVTFTGYLEDIRPAVASSQVCVVPLQEGAGTRLKILEAMALGTPVVSTTKGAEGLDVESGRHLLIADSPEEFAAHTLSLLNNNRLRASLSANAARLLRDQYDWRAIGSKFCDLADQTYAQARSKRSNDQ